MLVYLLLLIHFKKIKIHKLNINLLILFFLFLNSIALSQECLPKKNKYKRLINKVENYINENNLERASKILSSVKKKSLVFNSLRSEIEWLKGNDFLSKKFALEVLNICPDNFAIIYYILGEIYFREKDYVSSYDFLSKSIEIGLNKKYFFSATKLKNKAEKIALLINNPVSFKPKVVKGISSVFDEYLPSFSPDQELAFYTRRLKKKGIDIIVPVYEEQFTFSKMNTDGSFDYGKKMPFPFNQGANEGGASISIDNKIICFTKCSEVGSYNNCDIFISIKDSDKWSKIIPFNKKISRIDSWESQPTISADGNSIIFSSDREGGYGGIDLYIINRLKNGKWSEPVNLGPNINTEFNEKSPFLHIDNQTLFYSSTQFPSLGGYDIFYSRKDSIGNWNKPKNIGFPINTLYDDISLFVSTDGTKAFFASNKLEGVGGWDIYSFNLYDEAKPKKVLFIKGKLSDVDENTVGDVKMEFKNLNSSKKHSIYVNDGFYVAALTAEENDDFLLTIKKEGYIYNSKLLKAEDGYLNSPSKIDFIMKDISSTDTFTINDIKFSTNSFIISENSKHVLFSFAEFLNNNRLIIEIQGHTDNTGSVESNIELSKNRAEQVYRLLINYGVQKIRLRYRGFGDSIPVSSNDNEEGRALNRRTSFRIIKE